MANSQALEGFEEVFTVTDYYDGSRQGIASLNGHPHYYECVFSDTANDYINLYQLTPVDQDLFLLAMEDWAIWKRWEEAFHTGKADLESHPALPENRERHLCLKSILDERLRINPDSSLMRSAAFSNASSSQPPAGILVEMVVRWSEPDDTAIRIWAD
jgi:hypothetical protein